MSHGPRHPLAYDVTRLASRIFSRTPNGIDRVDMAYARHFLDQGEEGDCGVLFLGHLGMRRLERVRAQGVIEQIAVHFGERAKTADEEQCALSLCQPVSTVGARCLPLAGAAARCQAGVLHP
jgi:hypothetical protein